jgi:L-asparaginase II
MPSKACHPRRRSLRRISAWGDIDRLVFPRSAVKMIQALPLIETGAADRFALSDCEIALACASHSGEPGHVIAVRRWIQRLGLEPEALACGSHLPYDERAANALIASHEHPTPLHNNCSGKHAGFLTVARHLNLSLRDYVHASHPVQRLAATAVAEMIEFDLARAPRGTDGCGIPVYALPLRCLARAMAKLAAPQFLPPKRGQASQRIVAAMMANPWLVGGTARFDTQAIEAGAGRVVVKMGAEGVYVALAVDAGIGIALKIDDGARRAAEAAMVGILSSLGLIDDAGGMVLGANPVNNNRGETVGKVSVVDRWPGGPARRAIVRPHTV